MSISAADVEKFVRSVMEELSTGQTTEHSFRPAFKELFSNIEKIKSVNEPKQSEYGAPDFVFLGDKNRELILGYAEMKDIDKNLDEVEKSSQMERYRGYKNLFLTNNLDFRFFRNGAKYFEIKIGKFDKKIGQTTELYQGNYSRLADELAAFFEQTPESITSGKRLAEIMGGKARRIRDNIKAILEKRSDVEIEKIFNMMKELLVTDLTEDQFADMYAQTLVYGLFAARYNDETPDDFTRAEARDLVPATNPFLREFFDHIAGANFNRTLGYIVDELCEIFAVSDIKEIVHRHLKLDKDGKDTKDPIIHFYEDFLANYDAGLRKKMGAYYTPTPVVRYIVRMVDKVLKKEFGLSDGIASDRTIKYTHKVDPYQSGKTTRSKVLTERTDDIPVVQILDPAVGTATFLNESIKYIYEQKFANQKGLWNSYVNDNILPRFNGFELMMTPYTIAHLKLGMTLNELGAKSLKSRLRVFLTNTLAEGAENDLPLFTLLGLTKVVAEESNLAAEVKNDLPVMVVIGNPPYSGVSSNETKYANGLVEKYKVEPGGQNKLQERKHWLNDDYVKFIAFAEDMIEKNGKGIVAMITNNGYLDNPTFRGMRWHLMKTFDQIYVLDLHGNAKKKEVSPDGTPDQNVFDIMQGVSIMVAVKDSSSEKPAKVYHSEIYGSRKKKFEILDSDSPKYKLVQNDASMCYFVPKNDDGRDEYMHGVAINELMPANTTGILTMGDSFIVCEKPDIVQDRINGLINNQYNKNNLKEFDLGKNYADYILSNAKDLRFDGGKIIPLAYRPFDERYTYYDNRVIWRWREKVAKNMLSARAFDERDSSSPRGNTMGKNYAIVFNRTINQDYSHIFILDTVADAHLTGGQSYMAPLWLNYDLIASRQQKNNNGFHHIFASDDITELSYVSNETSEATSQFPLSTLSDNGGRRANFDETRLKELFSDVERLSEKSRKVYPEDMMDYIYASLHSPSFREKYKEFLKTDFPRVPRPKNWKEFWRLADLGYELRELHLMRKTPEPKATFSVEGGNVVEKVSRDNEKVYINDTQYFDNVSELAWNFSIGGYQPAQKWLKDRKGRTLEYDDILHYEKIIAVLEKTDEIMRRIG